MIKKMFSILAITSCMSGYMWSQTSIMGKINEVYGTYASGLTSTNISWIENCYSRCEIITEAAVPEGVEITSLLTVPLITKFGTDLVPDETYNSDTFNPLKYAINFHKKFDQYFRIGSTTNILKVHKKII